jgi:hypothetical protein
MGKAQMLDAGEGSTSERLNRGHRGGVRKEHQDQSTD